MDNVRHDDGGDDDELTRLALAADPDAPVPADAVPWRGWAPAGAGVLPEWYMPAAGATPVRGWRRVAALVIVAALVLIVANGLCSTDGWVSLA